MYNDEPFCISVALRLMKGDALFTEEWHPAQLIGFLLYPLVSIYQNITGGLTGILLCFRYLFIVFWIAVAVMLYFRLRKYGLFSVFAVLYFFLFAPIDYMTLSYTSIGLGCMLISLSTFLEERKPVSYIFAGIAFAIAVLCCPYLIVPYAAVSALIFIYIVYKTHIEGSLWLSLTKALPFKKWLFFTAGAAVIAVVLLLFIFSRSSFKEVLDSIPYLFSSAGHGSESFVFVLRSFYNSLVFRFSYIDWLGVPLIILTLADKHRYRHRFIYLLVSTALWVGCIYALMGDLWGNFNSIMLPVAFLGLEAFILTKHKDWKIFGFLFVAGWVYAFCADWASNTQWMAISMGTVVSGVGSVVLLGSMFAEMAEDAPGKARRFMCGLIAVAIISIQLGSETYLRYKRTYWDGYIGELTATIDMGPAKGLITTQTNKKNYTAVLDALNTLLLSKDPQNKPLLVLTASPWIYLAAGLPFGTFSSWTFEYSSIDALMDRESKYYSLHPQKEPFYIFVLNDSDFIGKDMQNYALNHKYAVEESNGFYLLEKNVD